MNSFKKDERVLETKLGPGTVIRSWPEHKLVAVKFDIDGELWMVAAKDLTSI